MPPPRLPPLPSRDADPALPASDAPRLAGPRSPCTTPTQPSPYFLGEAVAELDQGGLVVEWSGQPMMGKGGGCIPRKKRQPPINTATPQTTPYGAHIGFPGTVILWLLEDQVFWEEIEQGPEPLGPFGLQQFYLDMKFVIIFGQGRFLSRHVHQVILDIIGGAMSAFSATGMNPDRHFFHQQKSVNCVHLSQLVIPNHNQA
ncbi:hypothetical protein ABZP36_004613 [Zizania latifolia]